MIYDKIEDAFYFVSSASPGDHVAVLSRRTGALYYGSDMGGHDRMPDDLETSADYVEIPHRNDLVVGKLLVKEFVRLRCPEHLDRVGAMFTHPGAFSRYKVFFDENGVLEEWFRFEIDRMREVLMKWCDDNRIELS